MEKLYQEALNAYQNAYAPYSKFKVGCSILLSDGKIVTGCNVENASYGLTFCAERNAITSCISLGYSKKDFKAILIVANTKSVITPCGACRQVIVEFFDNDATVFLTNLNKLCKKISVKELLPYQFNEESLNV